MYRMNLLSEVNETLSSIKAIWKLASDWILLMYMVESVCSQMYVDPNRTISFMAIFLKLANLSNNA